MEVTAKYINNSTKVKPGCLRSEVGFSSLMVTLVLLISVTIIGGTALRFYFFEASQTTGDLVNYRLAQNARVGLEATYSFLNSMGTNTISGSLINVEEPALSTTLDATYCNYFPRTDDLILPISSQGNYADLNLSDSNRECDNARPNSPFLFPSQINSYTLANGVASSADISLYTRNEALKPISEISDQKFRSLFPWVRYRTQLGVMDAQYGKSENIQAQINQCGLSSQFDTSTVVPVVSYPYVQQISQSQRGLDLADQTLMDVGKNGLTLEAWVAVPSAISNTAWQKIFDIGRGQQDQNIILGYDGSNPLYLKLQLFPNCADSASNNSAPLCSAAGGPTYQELPNITVPGNNSIGDLWYYIAVVVPPQSAADNLNQVAVSIYTSCYSDNSAYDSDGNSCLNNSNPIPNSNFGKSGFTALYLNTTQNLDTSNLNGPGSRDIWVGLSHWGDPNLSGTVKNLKVWNTALPATQLGGPINPTYNSNAKTSTIITDAVQNNSLRLSPLYTNNNDRLLLFTAKETGYTFNNTFRLVSCAWNTKIPRRVTRSVRFRVVGDNRPEVLEYLPY